MTCQNHGANSAHTFQQASPNYDADCGLYHVTPRQDYVTLLCRIAEHSFAHAVADNGTTGGTPCLDDGFAGCAGSLFDSPEQFAEASAFRGAGKEGVDVLPVSTQLN